MNAKAFLDTNIFVYSFDRTAPEKQARSMALIKSALNEGSGIISYQVVQEFLNVATRKFDAPLQPHDGERFLSEVLWPLCAVLPSRDLFLDALEIRERWGFSFYDALIVAAASAAGCDRVLSEDLQHGQKVRDLVVENPFRA